MNFFTIKLNFKFLAFEKALLIYDLMTFAVRISWHDVLSYISEKISEFIFTYTLHVMNDMKFDYEYSDSLLTIQKNIELTVDKDIVVKSAANNKQSDIQQSNIQQSNIQQLDIQQSNIQQFTIQNNDKIANESFISKLNQLLKKFLFESEYIARKKLISKALFMQNQRQKMMKYHDNHDAFCSKNLLKWQHFVLEKLCEQMLRVVKKSVHMKLSKNLRTQLMNVQIDVEIALISAEICIFSNWFEDIWSLQSKIINDIKRYFDIQTAFIKFVHQTESHIESCKLVLEMKNVDKHDHAQILNLSVCIILSKCIQFFLDNQVNEAAFMLQRSCEKFFLNFERVKNSKLIDAIAKLKSVQTYEDIIVDIMRFEKTYISLLFLAVYAQSFFFFNTQSHRFALCIASSDIVFHQWQKIICKFLSLMLIIAYDERATTFKLSSNWIFVIVMREASQKLINWFAHLRYVFDKFNKIASNVIIFISYDTWVFKTLQTKRSITKEEKQKKTFESKWTNVINSLLLNEEHKLRHKKIKIYVNVKQLNAKII